MESLSNVWGDETLHKNVKIYPVRLRDFYEFYDWVRCLLIEKEKISDAEVIKMSYLRFIFALGTESEEIFKKFNNLLKLVFREQEFEFVSDNERIYILVEQEYKISEFQFDKIREIIFRQNLIVVNQIMDSELQKALDDAKAFMAKKNKSATIEEQIFSFHIATGIDFQKIKEMTIYQFNKSMERLNLKLSWEVYTYPALKAGDTKNIKHWLEHIPESGTYDDVIVNAKEITNKIEG